MSCFLRSRPARKEGSVQYFPLKRQPGHAALHALLDAVAPGGTLLSPHTPSRN
ncbi:hypothetical protein [Streptomyces sp. NPDC001508]|uniref:hypothetical protein n=1 Tax=Streptomyces sp. NPDC001508 TaxID=3154656 RepID=UPI00332F1A75